MSWDPVCGAKVERNQTNHTLEHNGIVYQFCSGSCQNAFQQKNAVENDAQSGDERGGGWIRYIHAVLMILALLFFLL
jgi:YHS domain-containing protein